MGKVGKMCHNGGKSYRLEQDQTFKHYFSGGQDTISLCHASLHADTIQILMLVKKQLHLAHAKATQPYIIEHLVYSTKCNFFLL